MIHNAPYTSSSIVLNQLLVMVVRLTTDGQVTFNKDSKKSVSHIECDTILMDDLSKSVTIPFNLKSTTSQVALEPLEVSKISRLQLYYPHEPWTLRQEATEMIVMGFVEPLPKNFNGICC